MLTTDIVDDNLVYNILTIKGNVKQIEGKILKVKLLLMILKTKV